MLTPKRRRKMHYHASSLHDRTVLAALPIRKPSQRIMKQYHARVDADGVVEESSRNGMELSDPRNETRTRFQDIIATNLNTRRAIRDLVLPALAALADDVEALRRDLLAATESSRQPPPGA